MTPKIITVIGSLNIDLVTTTSRVPSGGETITASSFSTGLGGKGANQAVACVRLSRKKPSGLPSTMTQDVIVKMVGIVGEDEFGSRIISTMTINGIDMSGVEMRKGQNTGVAVIIVEESSGENRILFYPGANHSLMAESFGEISSLGISLPEIIILQLEIPLSTVLQILRIAKRANVEVVLNPAPAVDLPAEAYQDLTHLILNESEALVLSGLSQLQTTGPNYDWTQVIQDFLDKGVQNVTITLGSRGALFGSNKAGQTIMEHVPAVNVEKVVDTTAAGDTFVGAYALGLVKGTKDIIKIIQYSCQAAARTVQKKGAQESIPWLDEVEL